MISSVSNVSFRSNSDLIGAPSKFSQQQAAPLAETESDAFVPEEKKSKKGLAVGIGAAALLGGFVGLGYAAKAGKNWIKAVEVPTEGFFAKSKAHMQNALAKVGEWGEKCINKVYSLFGKGKEAAQAAADAA